MDSSPLEVPQSGFPETVHTDTCQGTGSSVLSDSGTYQAAPLALSLPIEQKRSQPSEYPSLTGLVDGNHLQRNVIGAGGYVLGDPGLNGTLCAMRVERIDERIAAPSSEIVFREADPQEVAAVVRPLEETIQIQPSSSPRHVSIFTQDNGLFNRNNGTGTKNLARAGGVGWCG